MNVGMLWLDDSKRSMEEKVTRAAQYYEEKYGRSPNKCLVNQKLLEAEKIIAKITILPDKSIQPHHFWIGNEIN